MLYSHLQKLRCRQTTKNLIKGLDGLFTFSSAQALLRVPWERFPLRITSWKAPKLVHHLVNLKAYTWAAEDRFKSVQEQKF